MNYSSNVLGESKFRNLFFTLLFLMNVVLSSQTVLVHRSSAEDGDSKLDADGIKNGIVVWASGKVHVTSDYVIYDGYQLNIQKGAIVKIGNSVQVDANGKLVSWSSRGVLQVNGVLKADGAIITDLRDDAEGGDSNADGTATKPDPENLAASISFSGKGKDLLTNCTIKNLGSISNIGGMEISWCKFLNFLSIDRTDKLYGDAFPDINNNQFEFCNDKGYLDLRGLAPNVNGNVFGYSSGAVYKYNDKPAVIIGAVTYNSNQGLAPISGMTRISNNYFQTSAGIEVLFGSSSDITPCTNSSYQNYNFRALIYDNVFTGVSLSGSGKPGKAAIYIPVVSSITITGNEIGNFTEVIQLRDCSTQSISDVHINNNRFFMNSSGTAKLYRNLNNKETFLIDATNNYWGDATGPIDYYDDDGIMNARGKGLFVAKYVNYIPFVGGTKPPEKDKIQINAKVRSTLTELLPDIDAQIEVTVEKYQLTSADKGKIIAYVKDDAGYIYNQPGMEVAITAANTSTTLPTIYFKIPLGTDKIHVEAILTNDKQNLLANSNIVSIPVEQPLGSIKFANVQYQPNTKGYLYEGETYTITPTINYTLNSSGTIEFYTVTANSSGINTNSNKTIYPISAAVNKTVTLPSNQIKFDLQNYDVMTSLYLIAELKDASGKTVGRNVSQQNLFKPARLFFLDLTALKDGTAFEELNRSWFVDGEPFIAKIKLKTEILSSLLTNCRIVIQRYEFTERDLIYPTKSLIDNQGAYVTGIGPGTTEHNFIINQKSEILSSKYPGVKIIVQLQTGDGKIILAQLENTAYFSVEKTAVSLTKDIAAGSSNQTLSPIPVALNITSNPKAATLNVHEISNQQNIFKSNAKTLSIVEQKFPLWEFIPINRFWKFNSNISAGSLKGTITITYNPASDFPSASGFSEDSLIVAALNPFSEELEALPSTLNKTNKTVSASFDNFFETWVLASKKTKIVSGVNKKNELVTEFKLYQNYPNPFNPETVISYQISEISHITLKVYDVLGREMKTLVDEVKQPGFYNSSFYALHSSLSSGIYFCKLQADPMTGSGRSYTAVMKMMLIK